jgi:hypothetical protein
LKNATESNLHENPDVNRPELPTFQKLSYRRTVNICTTDCIFHWDALDCCRSVKLLEMNRYSSRRRPSWHLLVYQIDAKHGLFSLSLFFFNPRWSNEQMRCMYVYVCVCLSSFLTVASLDYLNHFFLFN